MYWLLKLQLSTQQSEVWNLKCQARLSLGVGIFQVGFAHSHLCPAQVELGAQRVNAHMQMHAGGNVRD